MQGSQRQLPQQTDALPILQAMVAAATAAAAQVAADAATTRLDSAVLTANGPAPSDAAGGSVPAILDGASQRPASVKATDPLVHSTTLPPEAIAAAAAAAAAATSASLTSGGSLQQSGSHLGAMNDPVSASPFAVSSRQREGNASPAVSSGTADAAAAGRVALRSGLTQMSTLESGEIPRTSSLLGSFGDLKGGASVGEAPGAAGTALERVGSTAAAGGAGGKPALSLKLSTSVRPSRFAPKQLLETMGSAVRGKGLVSPGKAVTCSAAATQVQQQQQQQPEALQLKAAAADNNQQTLQQVQQTGHATATPNGVPAAAKAKAKASSSHGTTTSSSSDTSSSSSSGSDSSGKGTTSSSSSGSPPKPRVDSRPRHSRSPKRGLRVAPDRQLTAVRSNRRRSSSPGCGPGGGRPHRHSRRSSSPSSERARPTSRDRDRRRSSSSSPGLTRPSTQSRGRRRSSSPGLTRGRAPSNERRRSSSPGLRGRRQPSKERRRRSSTDRGRGGSRDPYSRDGGDARDRRYSRARSRSYSPGRMRSRSRERTRGGRMYSSRGTGRSRSHSRSRSPLSPRRDRRDSGRSYARTSSRRSRSRSISRSRSRSAERAARKGDALDDRHHRTGGPRDPSGVGGPERRPSSSAAGGPTTSRSSSPRTRTRTSWQPDGRAVDVRGRAGELRSSDSNRDRDRSTAVPPATTADRAAEGGTPRAAAAAAAAAVRANSISSPQLAGSKATSDSRQAGGRVQHEPSQAAQPSSITDARLPVSNKNSSDQRPATAAAAAAAAAAVTGEGGGQGPPGRSSSDLQGLAPGETRLLQHVGSSTAIEIKAPWSGADILASLAHSSSGIMDAKQRSSTEMRPPLARTGSDTKAKLAQHQSGQQASSDPAASPPQQQQRVRPATGDRPSSRLHRCSSDTGGTTASAAPGVGAPQRSSSHGGHSMDVAAAAAAAADQPQAKASGASLTADAATWQPAVGAAAGSKVADVLRTSSISSADRQQRLQQQQSSRPSREAGKEAEGDRERDREGRERDRYREQGRARERARESERDRSIDRQRDRDRDRDRERDRGRDRSWEHPDRGRERDRDRGRDRSRSRDRYRESTDSPRRGTGSSRYYGRSSSGRRSRSRSRSRSWDRDRERRYRRESDGRDRSRERSRDRSRDRSRERILDKRHQEYEKDRPHIERYWAGWLKEREQADGERSARASEDGSKQGDKPAVSADASAAAAPASAEPAAAAAAPSRAGPQPAAAAAAATATPVESAAWPRGHASSVASFQNPPYCPDKPPSDAAVKYWRGRDGLVQDRSGNKWDPTSKRLVQAAPGGHDSRSLTSPAEQENPRKRQRRENTAQGQQGGAATAAAAAGQSNVQQQSSSRGGSAMVQQQQRQGRSNAAGYTPPLSAAAAPPGRPPPVQVNSPAAQAVTPLVSPGVATTPQGALGVAVLPEELDVDMEVDEPPGPQLPTVPPPPPPPPPPAAAAAAQGSSSNQPGPGVRPQQQSGVLGSSPTAARTTGRQFGSAALARRAQAAAAVKAEAGPVSTSSKGAATASAVPQSAASSNAATPGTPTGMSASPSSSRMSGIYEASQCYTEYPTVALQALQHNLSTLDMPSFKSSATLQLEASTLANTANKLSLSSGWDVRALLKHLQSGIKHLEWAHSFAGSGGVGVASISKQQAYKNNLTSAAAMVKDCARLTKQAIHEDKQRRAEGAPGHQGVVNYAFAALRLLADKLYAVASMNLLFVKTQGFNTTLRNLNNNTSHAATAAAAAAAAAAVVATEGTGPAGATAGGAAAGPPGAAATAAAPTTGIMAAPAARAPGGSRGRAGGGLPGGPSLGESGTQNSASSAVELTPLAPEGSSRTQDRLDLAEGVLDYISLTEHWAAVAECNEEYLKRTGHRRALAAAAEERRARAEAAAAAAAATAGAAGSSSSAAGAAAGGAGGVAGAAVPDPLPPGHCSAAALADAHRVGQLILAVGFEAGMWDLPSVLDIARQAADAIGNLVEEHGTPGAAGAAPAATSSMASAVPPVAAAVGSCTA